MADPQPKDGESYQDGSDGIRKPIMPTPPVAIDKSDRTKVVITSKTGK